MRMVRIISYSGLQRRNRTVHQKPVNHAWICCFLRHSTMEESVIVFLGAVIVRVLPSDPTKTRLGLIFFVQPSDLTVQ